jgi:hypothetical protein
MAKTAVVVRSSIAPIPLNEAISQTTELKISGIYGDTSYRFDGSLGQCLSVPWGNELPSHTRHVFYKCTHS